MPETLRSRFALPTALLIGVVTTLIYALYGWRQWHQLDIPSWDLGIFSQLAKAYSTFSAPVVSIKGEGFNLLGDHFHPILVVTGPLWRLWPSPIMLLVLQAVLFGLSAVPLTRLAVKRWGAPLGALLGAGYGLSWGLQSAVASQFHEIAFAVPIIAFSLTNYLRGRILTAALWMAALVFVKEDLGVTVAMFGLILAFRHRRTLRTVWIGAALTLWGALWLLLTTVVILPALNPHGQYDYTSRVGGIMGLLTPIDKWTTLGLLIMTAGVIGLRSPLILLMAPTIAWRAVGNIAAYWGWQWHYSAVLMPIAFAALLEASEKWPRWRNVGLIAALGATAVLSTSLPMMKLLDPAYHSPSPRWSAAQHAVESIPENSTVMSNNPLLAYFVPTAEVYWVNTDNPAPEYFTVDETNNWEDWNTGLTVEAYAEKHFGGDYEPHFSEEGFTIVRRR
ncbi:MAG: DUF2079 domain-containing protein [Propionibacteriaceae bacterium]|nr:DUF2079 domain-containing protein [Propionibacteriaceae bacterium]